MTDNLSPPALLEEPLLTEALEEYLSALEAGLTPDPKELQARYPAIAGRLASCLEGLEFMHRTAAEMHSGSGASAQEQGGSPPNLADYDIIREVGRGGMGIVYEGVQRSQQRRVALKVLSLGATLDPRHLQRFKNEAQAASQLQHPSIVPVFAVGCEQGVHYYAMRFIEGKTLGKFIRELRRAAEEKDAPTLNEPDSRLVRELQKKETREIVSSSERTDHGSPAPAVHWPIQGKEFFRAAASLGVQAAEALEHAHQVGIIHRDVKPANLLLDESGKVWVTDFGLARWPADASLTMSGDMLGTLPYMSPEQASARRGLVDHRTDIYSLGATLYELMTLQPVCRGGDHRELLQQILYEDPVPPRRLCKEFPRALETILLKALGKQVEERYATAQEMADDLRRYLQGQPILARRPALWERASKLVRRHRAVAVSVVAFLLLSVVCLAAGTIVIGKEQAKTRAAYEQEALAHQTEIEARTKEAEARAQADINFRDARRLVDHIAEIAAVDMAAENGVAGSRRKLLEAALSYYKGFIEKDDNRSTREDLLRGYVRVASILDAVGRQKDAQAVRSQAIQIALTSADGDPAFRFVVADKGLRLLKLPAVQSELKLDAQQVKAILALKPKGNESAEPIDAETLAILTPEQAKRLRQLLLQQARIWAFKDPAVVKSLQLTPGQRQALIAAVSKKGQSAPPGVKSEKPTLDQILWLLTAEQKTRWREMTGEPFRGELPPGDIILVLGKMTLTTGSK